MLTLFTIVNGVYNWNLVFYEKVCYKRTPCCLKHFVLSLLNAKQLLLGNVKINSYLISPLTVIITCRHYDIFHGFIVFVSSNKLS